jgi:hypothetical protein
MSRHVNIIEATTNLSRLVEAVAGRTADVDRGEVEA